MRKDPNRNTKQFSFRTGFFLFCNEKRNNCAADGDNQDNIMTLFCIMNTMGTLQVILKNDSTPVKCLR